MSHTATVKSIKIQSISALRGAIQELAQSGIKCSLLENAVPRAYFGNQAGMELAPYVVKLTDSPYDIGLYRQADGSYETRTDFFAGHIERLLGTVARTPEATEQAKMGKLFQMYGLYAATEAAKKKGLMVQRVSKSDGTMTLVLTGLGL